MPCHSHSMVNPRKLESDQRSTSCTWRTCRISTCFSLLWCSLITLMSDCTCVIAAQTVPAWDRSLQLLVFRGSNSPIRPRVVRVCDPALPLECGSHLSAWIYVLAAHIPAQDTDLPVVYGFGLSACLHSRSSCDIFYVLLTVHLVTNSC